MNRRELLLSTLAAAVAPALPAQAEEASPFPKLYWRFTLSNGRRTRHCGFPFDVAARSALQWGDAITKIERLDGSAGWREMRVFGAGTVTPAFLDMMVARKRAWQGYMARPLRTGNLFEWQ